MEFTSILCHISNSFGNHQTLTTAKTKTIKPTETKLWHTTLRRQNHGSINTTYGFDHVIGGVSAVWLGTNLIQYFTDVTFSVKLSASREK